jgi:hypothetical protein
MKKQEGAKSNPEQTIKPLSHCRSRNVVERNVGRIQSSFDAAGSELERCEEQTPSATQRAFAGKFESSITRGGTTRGLPITAVVTTTTLAVAVVTTTMLAVAVVTTTMLAIAVVETTTMLAVAVALTTMEATIMPVTTMLMVIAAVVIAAVVTMTMVAMVPAMVPAMSMVAMALTAGLQKTIAKQQIAKHNPWTIMDTIKIVRFVRKLCLGVRCAPFRVAVNNSACSAWEPWPLLVVEGVIQN